MIPYIEIPAVHLWGPFSIQPFGLLVVSGTALGVFISRRRAREMGFDVDEYDTSLYWGLGMGFFMAHVIEILFYQTEKLESQGPIVLLKVWEGLSSMGGLYGAVFGLWIYWGLIKKKPWLAQAEFVIQGLIFGWAFGRLGCTIVHDHPGKLTDFFLGVQYPDGVRHDLGFYEFLFTALILVPANLWLYRKRPPRGTWVALACLPYAPVRFAFDFLRIEEGQGADPRYLGLTMGHWGSVGLLVLGAAFGWRAWKNRGEVVRGDADEGS